MRCRLHTHASWRWNSGHEHPNTALVDGPPPRLCRAPNVASHASYGLTRQTHCPAGATA